MRNFRELKIREKSHQLTLLIYQATKNFPKEELFGLTSQIRRACSSIPANIAEGCGRQTERDFARFLQIAFGSVSELEYHLLLANDLKLLNSDSYKVMENLLLEIKKMLASFIQKLNADG
jgi:four helix bundle protein